MKIQINNTSNNSVILNSKFNRYKHKSLSINNFITNDDFKYYVYNMNPKYKTMNDNK